MDGLDSNSVLNSTLENTHSSGTEECQIPVRVCHRTSETYSSPRPKVLKTIKRLGIKPKSLNLPNVMALNPRSVYGKAEYLADTIREYQVYITCISESWNRENNPLNNIISIENHKLYMNVKQREQRGGKPLIIVNHSKFIVKQPCPSLFCVP